MSGSRAWEVALETFVGIAIFFGMLAAVDCLPGMTKHPQHPALADGGAPACAVEAYPALLCNRVTKTSPPRECAICPDPARHCLTSTGIYCVANGCDNGSCTTRQKLK